MIIYKTKGWLDAIWHFHTGSSAVSLLKRLSVVTIYVTVVTVIELRYLDLRLTDTPSQYVQALGILLSLLLLFRTNTAYDRFYEGRSTWGALVNTMRNLSVMFNTMLPQEVRADRLFLTKTISNFAVALKNHLREMPQLAELELVEDWQQKEFESVDNWPNEVVNQLRGRVEQLYANRILTDAQLINLNDQINRLLDVSGICERIKSTPIPFSYSLFIKLFTVFYLGILPFTVIEWFGYMTIPIMLITSYFLIGLEMIGVEIEEPFGTDRNDLPLSQLAHRIRVDAHEIMRLPVAKEDKMAAKPDFMIVN
ncbi:bestrophin family protein [Spirosoma sp. 209]|uniref:bestrophin family protein n=1 Tax=Spirosoma sp. 209 TaxID=1955701 RepID=UPI00098CF744|nr:bestrophin family protein [Spirosoma sp. 209]